MKDQLAMSKLTCLIITICYFSIGGLLTLFSQSLSIILAPQSVSVPQFSESTHWLFLGLSSCTLYAFLYYWSGIQTKSQASLEVIKRGLERFLEYSKAMIKADNEKLILQEACRICVDVGDYRMAFVVTAELDKDKTLTPVAHWGEAGTFFDHFQATWDSGTKQGNCLIGTSIHTGQPVVFQNLKTDPRYQHCCKDAKECGFSSCLSLPLKDDNRISGALVIFHTKPDAFDNKEIELLETLANNLSYGIANIRMEAEYRRGIEEQLMLAAITDQTSDGVITFTPNGIIQYVNPGFIKLCGVPFDEIMGSSIHQIECSKRNPEFYQAILGAIRVNHLRTGRFINKDRSGQEHDIDGRIAPILDKMGRVVRYVVTVRDVSREVQLQRELRQAQKMEILATVTETVAADLKKQLERILVYSTSGLEKGIILDPAQEDLLGIIGAVTKSKNMLEQLTAVSQRSEQPTCRINFSELVNHIITSLHDIIPTTIRIIKHIDLDSAMVAANTGQIHQVIKHLFDNAREAMEQNGGVLEIGLSNTEIRGDNQCQYPNLCPGKYLKLTITDTGHGMNRNELEFIFDPFYSTKDQRNKRGLGLSISQRIIKNHGGHISVNSIVGTGTSFTILLPQVLLGSLAEIPC